MARTRQEFLQALEHDMLAHHRPFSVLRDSKVHPQPDCFVYESKVNFGAFGGILAQRFTPENVDARIAELNTIVKASGKDLGWVISSLATPTNLGDRLAAAGGTKIVDLTGMALNLEDLPDAPTPEGIEIRHVDDEISLEHYSRIYPLLFNVPVDGWIEDLVSADLEIFRTQSPNWNRWVAYENGVPLAAGRTGQMGEIAALQILCTLPEHRNRGIGQALATIGLRHEGRDSAVVWAGPTADRLYSRMGFKAICTTSVYVFV